MAVRAKLQPPYDLDHTFVMFGKESMEGYEEEEEERRSPYGSESLCESVAGDEDKEVRGRVHASAVGGSRRVERQQARMPFVAVPSCMQATLRRPPQGSPPVDAPSSCPSSPSWMWKMDKRKKRPPEGYFEEVDGGRRETRFTGKPIHQATRQEMEGHLRAR
jgi:hypothetical protein